MPFSQQTFVPCFDQMSARIFELPLLCKLYGVTDHEGKQVKRQEEVSVSPAMQVRRRLVVPRFEPPAGTRVQNAGINEPAEAFLTR